LVGCVGQSIRKQKQFLEEMVGPLLILQVIWNFQELILRKWSSLKQFKTKLSKMLEVSNRKLKYEIESETKDRKRIGESKKRKKEKRSCQRGSNPSRWIHSFVKICYWPSNFIPSQTLIRAVCQLWHQVLTAESGALLNQTIQLK
jgi:hypothetical protein